MSFRAIAKRVTVFTASVLLLATPGVFAAGPQSTDDSVKKAIAAIDQLAQKKIAEGASVGLSIAVVHKDKVVFAKGYGLREVGKDAKVDADTVFQLASVSKPIGATVVAALVGDGKITWDSKISNLDPDFEMFDPWVTRQITIRDLYAHRSGLPDHCGDNLEDIGFDREQVLHSLRFQKPDSSFRSHYAYTNFGLTEAAVAAAKAYGQTWEDASQQKLYGPLGMKSTSSRHADFMARTNKALLHVLVDGKWVQKFNRDPDAQSPAGGVSSSAADLAQWMRLELANGKFDGKQIVAEAPLTESRIPEMLTQFNPFTGLPGFYGLGMNVSYDEHGQLHLSHSGGFDSGASTTISFMPGEQLGIIVLSNTYPIGVPESLSATFFDLALYGKQSRDWFPFFKQVLTAAVSELPEYDYSKPPTSPTLALSNASYVGSYTNEFAGDVVIMEKDGGLVMTQGPKGFTFPLKHYDRDIFSYETIGENAVGRSGIAFAVDAAGKATAITVYHLNQYGNTGVFKRVTETR